MVHFWSTSTSSAGSQDRFSHDTLVKKDLTGILLDNQKEIKGDQWDLVEFPAIMDHGTKQEPVWPQFWKLDELEKVKATLPVGKWNAQWMQNPTSEEGAILKREWWKLGTKIGFQLSLCYYVDGYGVFKKRNSRLHGNYSLGVFYPNEDQTKFNFTRCVSKNDTSFQNYVVLH